MTPTQTWCTRRRGKSLETIHFSIKLDSTKMGNWMTPINQKMKWEPLSNLFNYHGYGRGHNNQLLAFQWSLVSSLLWQKSRPFNRGPWNKRCSLCATVQLEWVATGSVGFFKGKLGSKWSHGDPEWLRWLYYITDLHRLVFFSWGYISPFLVIPNLVLYHKNL